MIALRFPMTTIRCYNDNGPYFPPTEGIYQAASLKDVLFHVRMCMDSGDQQIGLFDANGECKGMWLDEAEPEPDGEGGMTMGRACYVLHRRGSMSERMWQLYMKHFGKA